MQLTVAEIRSIIKAGEGYNAEFKVSIPSKVTELSAEICAFANAAGGIILLGIDDFNEIQGIEIDNRKHSSIQNAINQLKPHLFCPLYFLEIDQKQIGVIEVPSGIQKPYTLSGAIYIRQGPYSQKITSVEQMRDFFQQSGRIYFDEGINTSFSFKEDLSFDFFKEFRILAGFSPAIDDAQIIQNLRLTNEHGHFKNGSILFMAKAPEFFFEKAVVRCVAFEGTDKSQIIDDKIWGGPLMHQYRHALQWLKTKLDVRYEIKGSGPRKEIWEIPEVALKEALINALSHRDYYDKGGRITIELFVDRLELTNPGGLVSAIKPAEFGHKSHSRNPLIFGLFERIDMVEQIGSGINRIISETERAGLPRPIFKTEGLFTVIFYFRKIKTLEIENQELSDKVLVSIYGLNMGYLRDKYGINCVVLLSRIHQNPGLTRMELSSIIGVGLSTIEKLLAKLKKDGLIKRDGARKKGEWKITSKQKNIPDSPEL